MDASDISSKQLSDFFQTSFNIAFALDFNDLHKIIQQLFLKTSLFSSYIIPENDTFAVVVYYDPDSKQNRPSQSNINVTRDLLKPFIQSPVNVVEKSQFSSLPSAITNIFPYQEIDQIAFVPVLKPDGLVTLFCFGGKPGNTLSSSLLEPYMILSGQLSMIYDRIEIQKTVGTRLEELELIAQTNQLISTTPNLAELYKALHSQIRKAIGDYSFLIALYDPLTTAIRIPYMYEEKQVTSIESFPMGEGLTSIVLRTKQPLLIVKDTEKRAAALGAKIVGKSAKSWLGVPLIVSGEASGAIIIQDTEKENAFTERDLNFMTTLAAQVAGAILNVRMLEETRIGTVQLQTAAEIARDISTSLDLSDLLLKAVNLIRERFSFYHSSIFLIDDKNEFAVIREATGDAGYQLKRTGHKLAVGSNSIVGYVTGTGDPLIVNDTSRDTTYYPNPLLPQTRAEVGIPLKVGPRILGVLDVQSIIPYSFTEDNIRVLQVLADQLSIAIINSELFSETQEHLSQHRLLYHVTSSAASSATLEEALTSAVQGIQVTLGGDRVVILLLNIETDLLEIKSSVGYSDDALKVTVPIGSGITGWVAKNKQLLRIDDVTNDSRYIILGSDVRSELALPLIYRGELLGVLNVESDRVNAYNENDEELLTTLGGSLAAIIANARLIEQIRHQADKERLLYEITARIRKSTDTQTILEVAASEITRAIGAKRTKIKIDPTIK
jgi:GAF domain-containing protein